MFVSGQEVTKNQGFGDLGFQGVAGKQFPANNLVMDASSVKVDGEKLITPIISPAFSLEDESISSLSNSIVDSNSRDSSFIDLKLGGFGESRDAQNSTISKAASFVSTSKSYTPLKRVRTGVNSRTAYCQVYGCNKDLSSSKEYHKKHKVCEAHSKTATVIVNGIEQRFCQQCSRFHSLPEFDDGKRSCRKRLAGHNERRRKPQVGVHSARTGRLLQSITAFDSNRFHGSPLAASFICQDILPTGLSQLEKYGSNDWGKRIKVEDGTDFSPLSAIPITNGHVYSKSLFPSNNSEKAFPSFHDNRVNNARGSIFSENTNQYAHDLGGQNSASCSLPDISLGSEDFAAFDAASTIQGFSEITDSGSALSLLSSQSYNSSIHPSGIPLAHPLILAGCNMQCSMSQVSDKLIGVSSEASRTEVSNKFSSSGISSVDGTHLLSPLVISDGNGAVNYDITDGIYQGSHFVNAKDHLFCEEGTTIDLLQLSSQLQCVKRQK